MAPGSQHSSPEQKRLDRHRHIVGIVAISKKRRKPSPQRNLLPAKRAPSPNYPAPNGIGGDRPANSQAVDPTVGNKNQEDHRQRRDLLAFVNGLYTGAISLGVAHFAYKIKDNFPSLDFSTFEAWKSLGEIFLAAIGLTSALAIVIDDWRHARWVNEDYGYRIDPSGPCVRYWLDCFIAIASYLLLASSFDGTVQYPLWLGAIFILGWYWSKNIQKEIRSELEAKRPFPSNSINITKDLLEGRVHEDKWYRYDYRVNFVYITHLKAGLISITIALMIFLTQIFGPLLQKSTSTDGEANFFLNLFAKSFVAIGENAKHVVPVMAIFAFILLKALYHQQHKRHFMEVYSDAIPN